MTKFRNIPEPPYTNKVEDLNWFEQVKYNLEILMGQRQQDAAILRSNVNLAQITKVNLTRLKTGQQGVLVSGQTVPTLIEYQTLQQDVESLRLDVEQLRTYTNSLLLQLKNQEG